MNPLLTTLSLIQYYVNLLIIQYHNLSRATSTVFADVTPVIMPLETIQSIIFSPSPTVGTFTLAYNGVSSAVINWNDSAATIQTKLRTTILVNGIPLLPQIVVTGSISTSLTITFMGFANFANLLTVPTNSLMSGITPTVVTVVYVVTLGLQFSLVPDAGSFSLSYNGNTTALISPVGSPPDTAVTIQAKLNAIPALWGVTVYGDFVNGFVIYGASQLLILATNTLTSAGNPVQVTLPIIDQTLPIAVENGFDLEYAQGKQLDTIAKYIGVTRSSNTKIGNITLNDSDFLTLLRFAIIQNTSGSSMYDIEYNMNLIFPGQFLIFDYKNMFMSYILSTALGSSNLFSVLLQERLLPVPMAVGFSVIVTPVVTNFFGFSTYPGGVLTINKPFNTYSSFNKTWIWLSYSYGYFP